MFTLYPLKLKFILYNRIGKKGGERMAVLEIGNSEYKKFPAILQDYAGYTTTIRGNSKKTVCEYLLDLRTFFRFLRMKNENLDLSADEFEKLEIKDFTLSDVNKISEQQIIEFLMYTNVDRSNGPGTRMRKLSAIRSFFNYVYTKKRLIDSNPAAEIDSPKQKKSLPKYMTLDESIRFLNAIQNSPDSKTVERDICIFTLFLNTGMRLSELIGLNIDSFDSELSQVKVLGKGNKERIIYLNDACRHVLKNHLRKRLDPKYIRTNEKALFISRLETRISAKTVQWLTYKYLAEAGLGHRGLSVHKLRHTAATLMYQTGKVDIRVLKDILGHEQLNTTQIYTHVVSRNMEEAMDQNPLASLHDKK